MICGSQQALPDIFLAIIRLHHPLQFLRHGVHVLRMENGIVQHVLQLLFITLVEDQPGFIVGTISILPVIWLQMTGTPSPRPATAHSGILPDGMETQNNPPGS